MRNRNIIFILFIVFSTSVLAQEKEQVRLKDRPASIEIGLVPLALSQENSLSVNFSLTYKKVLTDKFTLSLEGLYSATGKLGFFGDVSSRGGGNTRSFYDIRGALSLDLRYFLKENKQEGHYFGLRVNNLLTYTDIREDFSASSRYSLRPKVRSLPMIGFYTVIERTLSKTYS